MIGVSSGVRIWLCTAPTDMRCGVDGLAALVQGKLDANPFSGQLFIFRGRKGHIVKCFWSDPGQGLPGNRGTGDRRARSLAGFLPNLLEREPHFRTR